MHLYVYIQTQIMLKLNIADLKKNKCKYTNAINKYNMFTVILLIQQNKYNSLQLLTENDRKS